MRVCVLPVVGPLGPNLLHVLSGQKKPQRPLVAPPLLWNCAFLFHRVFSQGLLNRAEKEAGAGSHLLDQLAPAPGADLSVPGAQQVAVGGQQAEDGTFVGCGRLKQVKAANG